MRSGSLRSSLFNLKSYILNLQFDYGRCVNLGAGSRGRE
jgi:hypothetical protein